MNLIRRNLVPKNFDEMDEVFNRWMTSSFENWPTQAAKAFGNEFNPQVEVKENKNSYEVTAEMAGLNKEDIHVDFENNSLTLKGEKRTKHERKEGEKVHYSERYYGNFIRTIPFAQEIDSNKIEADYKNGVLNISLPKKPTDKAYGKTIAIR